MGNVDPITRASPSLVEALHQCGLRVALARRGPREGASTPWTRLGTACHEIFEAAARGNLGNGGDDFDNRFDAAWAAAVSAQEREAKADPLEHAWGPARAWPGYSLKRARLRRRARELAHELHGWRDPVLRVEEELAPDGEVLFGRPDLVVREPPPYRVVDYKTGAIADDSGDVKAGYRRQLLLYAYLERAMPDGGEPEMVVVVPLHGPPVNIPVDWDEVAAVVAEAHDLVEHFNAHRDTPEVLANPGIEACGHCPFAARCDVMWDHLPDGLAAAEGIVSNVTRTDADTVSFTLDAKRASNGPGPIRFHGFSLARVPALTRLADGATLRIVGFRVMEGGATTARPRGWVRANFTAPTS